MNDGGVAERAAYAGFWRRFAAYSIDYFVVLVAGIVLGALVLRAGIVADGTQGRFTLWLALGYFLYCALLESSSWQATVGKRAMGIRVTNRRGERIAFARAAVRFVAKLLSVLTLFLGYLLAALTPRRQALHDLIAGTLVTHDSVRHTPTWVVAAISVVAGVPLLAAAAAIAVPAYQDYAIRAQVTEGLDLANGYRRAVEAAWRNSSRDFAELTSDSVAAGLPRAGRYVESIEVVSGMIVISYGGAANESLAGSVLALVPALDRERTLGWACGYGPAPTGFATVFEGHAGYTDIDERYIPSLCRSTP
ncbi:MAG TPA: RDD family protein [Gammaproteobacteria bacterium]|nr:RDD family protein [Gammaproteobacteria bacterium]